MELHSVARNLIGFMAKGEHEPLLAGFSYENSEGIFYEGVLLPGTLVSEGLSDHLRIYTALSVTVDAGFGL